MRTHLFLVRMLPSWCLSALLLCIVPSIALRAESAPERVPESLFTSTFPNQRKTAAALVAAAPDSENVERLRRAFHAEEDQAVQEFMARVIVSLRMAHLIPDLFAESQVLDSRLHVLDDLTRMPASIPYLIGNVDAARSAVADFCLRRLTFHAAALKADAVADILNRLSPRPASKEFTRSETEFILACHDTEILSWLQNVAEYDQPQPDRRFAALTLVLCRAALRSRFHDNPGAPMDAALPAWWHSWACRRGPLVDPDRIWRSTASDCLPGDFADSRIPRSAEIPPDTIFDLADPVRMRAELYRLISREGKASIPLIADHLDHAAAYAVGLEVLLLFGANAEPDIAALLPLVSEEIRVALTVWKVRNRRRILP